MATPSSIGRVALGTALLAFGAENLLVGGFLPELQPAPAWLPSALAYGNAAALIAGGSCLVTDRRTIAAARGLIGLLAIWLVAFYLPGLVVTPRSGGLWTGAAEVTALVGGLAALALPARPAVARVVFGVTLPIFGFLHFLYIDYVASVIPGWIPGHVFWGYATGVAHAAAGAALLTGIRARLAAQLLATMFGAWVVILHLPRALAAAGQRGEWTSLAVALAMTGASLLLIGRRSE